jgi:hypothetical protein
MAARASACHQEACAHHRPENDGGAIRQQEKFNDGDGARRAVPCPATLFTDVSQGVLRAKFGDVVSAWLNKREKFGPGFYLQCT